MAGRSHKHKDPEIKHLSEPTISELSQAVWEFPVTETGNQEVALRLKPKKLREYAGDFLDSEEGRFYWPLSEGLQQWQYEPDATHADVKKWIGELMIRERRRREAEDSIIHVDDPHVGSSAKKKKGKAPTEGPNASQKREPLGRPQDRAEEGVRSLGTAKASSKADPIPSTRRAKSPTVAPDVPYEDVPQSSRSASKKSLKPTPAAVRIAGEKVKSPEKSDSDSVFRAEGRSAALGLDLSRSPTNPRKRPAETEDVAGLSASSSVWSNKKVALSSSAPLQEPPLPFPSPRDDPITSTSLSAMMMPPPRRERERPSTQTGEQPPEVPSSVVAAYGLQYSVENLSKVPERVLEYLTECIQHQIRLANNTDNAMMKQQYRARSTLFQKMHADLESRIKCLAEDAEARQWVECSHCLWGS